MYYIINKEDIQYNLQKEAYVPLNTPYNIQWGAWVLFFIDKKNKIYLTVFSKHIMNNDEQLSVYIPIKKYYDGVFKDRTGIVRTSYYCRIKDKGAVLDLELYESHEYLERLEKLVLVPIKELPSILLGTSTFNGPIKL